MWREQDGRRPAARKKNLSRPAEPIRRRTLGARTMEGIAMSATTTTSLDYYVTGLANLHAVEGQAAATIQAELSRMEPYPSLHARMVQELDRTKVQAQRLETLMAHHQKSASAAKETVTSLVGKVSGYVHVPASDEVVKNVLAASGFKAYEISSYKMLIALAESACPGDVATLRQSMTEEQEMGDWIGENLSSIVQAYLAKTAR